MAVPTVVPLVYGTAFRGFVAVIWCMLPGLVIFSAVRTAQTYLAATDNLRPVVIASAGGAAAGLLSLLVLVPLSGVVGTGIADSVGYAVFAASSSSASAEMACSPGVRCAARRCCRGTRQVASAGVTAIRARQIALGCAAVVAALGVVALSIRDTATVSALLGALILLLIVAAPDTGLYTLAIALPVSQTTFGIKLISDQDHSAHRRRLPGRAARCGQDDAAAGAGSSSLAPRSSAISCYRQRWSAGSALAATTCGDCSRSAHCWYACP